MKELKNLSDGLDHDLTFEEVREYANERNNEIKKYVSELMERYNIDSLPVSDLTKTLPLLDEYKEQPYRQMKNMLTFFSNNILEAWFVLIDSYSNMLKQKNFNNN